MGSFMSQELFHDPDDFERVMCVNVKGVALGIKHAMLVMIPRAIDCIILTASVAGVSGGMVHTPTQHPNMPLLASLRTLPANLTAMVYVSIAFCRSELP